MKKWPSLYDVITGVSAAITRRSTKHINNATSYATDSTNQFVDRMAPRLLQWAAEREVRVRDRIQEREGTVTVRRNRYRW